MTFATASPLGVLFTPTNMVINVDIVAAWSLQTNLPQKAHEARGSSSQCQHFIISSYFAARTNSTTPLKDLDHSWSGKRSENKSLLALSAISNESGRTPVTMASN